MDSKKLNENIEYEKKMIQRLSRRKQQLELHRAEKGIDTLPHINTEILDLTEEIHVHEEVLKEYQSRLDRIQTSSEQQKERIFMKADRPEELRVLEGDDMFYQGINFLKADSHREVLIYAPTGVWTDNSAKAAWFRAVAGCLANKSGVYPPQEVDRSVTTKLDNFVGVYGIPPKPKTDDQYEIDQFSEKLDLMEDLLVTFNEMDRAHIYYLEVDTSNIPGTGAILIDNAVITLAFAIGGCHMVDYGISISGRRDIVTKINQWFNRHVMNLVKSNVIQDMRIPKSVKQGMDEIRENYGLPPKNITTSL